MIYKKRLLNSYYYINLFTIKMKIIFVTWGSISWLWKWITASSIWRILKSSWLSIWMVKMDPYLQVDAWTMSPYEHGEVFVTEDWAETDLDLWNYERFTDENYWKDNNITTWKVYLNVINKERQWKYLWKTVQIIPHITNEIKSNILITAKRFDVTIVEVGWTVWDIESQPFLEAIRQMKKDIWKENILYLHVAPLLYLDFSWEIKTKLIQHSIIKLREYWILPDILVCRTNSEIDKKIKSKISMLCDIEYKNIIEAKNAKTIYEVPNALKKQNIDKIIMDLLKIEWKTANLIKWNKLVKKIIEPEKEITIWVIWKYVEFEDTYKSINEAFIHAWAANNTKVKLNWINSEKLETKDYKKILKKLRKEKKLSWILIPWGFWNRWSEWKINAVNFARTNNIPFLGICLWLQIAIIEFARNICWLKKANSIEFWDDIKDPVIDFMEEQKNISNKWWTMRLWSYEAILKKWSLAHQLYKSTDITERHRHRYEVNPNYHNILKENWMIFSWMSPDRKLVEFIELENHPYFIATQAHPEFKSRLDKPHPLFVWLVKESIKN